MLIAAKCTREAELFKTALSLAASGSIVPNEIKDYFASVLMQAKELVRHPESVKPDILPEAIDLALEIKNVEALSDSLQSVEKLDSLTVVQASEILRKMEYCSVC